MSVWTRDFNKNLFPDSVYRGSQTAVSTSNTHILAFEDHPLQKKVGGVGQEECKVSLGRVGGSGGKGSAPGRRGTCLRDAGTSPRGQSSHVSISNA